MVRTVVGEWVKVFLCLVCCLVSIGISATAFAADLDLALSMLPNVGKYEVDTAGHLIYVEGELTPSGPSVGERLASGFVRIHRDLYPRPSDSQLKILATKVFDGGTVVELVQSVDGFDWVDGSLTVESTDAGVITMISGLVLTSTDIPSTTAAFMTAAKATDKAASHVASGGSLVSVGTRPVIKKYRRYRRCWSVDLVYSNEKGQFLYRVTVDALTERILGVETEDVTGMTDWGRQASSGGGPRPSKAIDGCTPIVPAVGEFTTVSGAQQWEAYNLDPGGSWGYTGSILGSTLVANQEKYVCPSGSLSPCNHGAITRSGLALPAGYDRFAVTFKGIPSFGDYHSLTLRWGPGEDEAILLELGYQELNWKTFVWEGSLGEYDSWDSSSVDSLSIEIDEGISRFNIQQLDILPGPWIELAGPPEISFSSGQAQAGSRYSASQPIVNQGCGLPWMFNAPYLEQRELELTMFRLVESGGELIIDPNFTPEVVCSKTYNGMLAAGGSTSVPLCLVQRPRLPEPGWWLFEARFPGHDVPSTSTIVEVQPVPIPDVRIDSSQTVEPVVTYGSYSQRIDTLDATWCAGSNSLELLLETELLWSSTRDRDEVRGDITVRMRTHDPDAQYSVCPAVGPPNWEVVGVLSDHNFTGHQARVLIDPSNCLSVLPDEGEWSLLDLWIHIDLDSSWGETNLENNDYCIPRWIPAADVDHGLTTFAQNVAPSPGDDIMDYDYLTASPIMPQMGAVDYQDRGCGSSASYSCAASITYLPDANETLPYIGWALDGQPDDDLIAGLMVRYRRRIPGTGTNPYLAAGAHETSDTGDPFSTDIWNSQTNRNLLLSDNQWQVAVWRRGSSLPFGDKAGFAPFEEEPSSGGTLFGVMIAPDTNEIQTDYYPETFIDFIRLWKNERESNPGPVFETLGIYQKIGNDWYQLSNYVEKVVDEAIQLAVGIKNIGNQTEERTFDAQIAISDQSKSPDTPVLTGSVTMSLQPGDSQLIVVFPPWNPVIGFYGLTATIYDNTTHSNIDDGVGLPVEVWSVGELTTGGLMMKDENEDWVPLPTVVPTGMNIELGLEVLNSGSTLRVGVVAGDLWAVNSSVVYQELMLPNLSVTIPRSPGGSPGSKVVEFNEPWVPERGWNTLRTPLPVLFDGDPIGAIDDPPLFVEGQGCPIPVVVLP